MSSAVARGDASPEWAPKSEFEHISWNEIIEAEEEGDMDKLNSLKDRSMDIKRALSCPEPDTLPTTFTPHNTPLNTSLPFEEFDDYPSLPCPKPTLTPTLEHTANKLISYAQALEPRLAKRTLAERSCISPIDYLPKRSALARMVSTPTEVAHSSSPTTTKIHKEDVMDTGTTPDNDCKPNKATFAAQRRLFPPSKENFQPIFTPNASPHVPESRSRSSSIGSAAGKEGPNHHQVAQREKQIHFGKNTLGYQRYIETVSRQDRGPKDPWTPDKNKACSTRSWQGQIRVWRRALHKHDPPASSESSMFTAEEAALCHMDILQD